MWHTSTRTGIRANSVTNISYGSYEYCEKKRLVIFRLLFAQLYKLHAVKWPTGCCGLVFVVSLESEHFVPRCKRFSPSLTACVLGSKASQKWTGRFRRSKWLCRKWNIYDALCYVQSVTCFQFQKASYNLSRSAEECLLAEQRDNSVCT